MRISLYRVCSTRPVIKIIALFLGYWLWYGVSNYQNITYSCSVPLCFDNCDTKQKKIDAPEMVHIVLQGCKRDLLALDIQQLAVHLDGAVVYPGTHHIYLTDAMLLLPDTVKMLHCTPSPVVIHVSSSSNQA